MSRFLTPPALTPSEQSAKLGPAKGFFRKAWVARRLLTFTTATGLWFWALSQGGCLLPEDPVHPEDVLVRRNRPPVIVEQQLEPPASESDGGRVLNRNMGANCKLPFEVHIDEEDREDRLAIRWYVTDLGGGNSSEGTPVHIKHDGRSDNMFLHPTPDGGRRRGPLKLTFYGKDPQNSPRLLPSALYLVEVQVTDGTFNGYRELVVDETGSSPANLTSFGWLIYANGEECPP